MLTYADYTYWRLHIYILLKTIKGSDLRMRLVWVNLTIYLKTISKVQTDMFANM